MSRAAIAWIPLLLGLLCAGCVPATETFVILNADPELRGEATLTVRYQPDDIPVPMTEVFETGLGFWPHTLAFHPRDRDTSRRFEFEATLQDADGTVQVGARLGFSGQNRVEFLFERACRDVLCRDGFTCRDAVCVPSLPTGECPDLVGVCDPATSCGCEPGFECVEAEDGEPRCEAPPALEAIPCTGPSDCPAGELCDLESGECRPRPAESCPLPPSADGEALLGVRCGGHDDCAAGLACVGALRPVGTEEELQYTTDRATCASACDPCVATPGCAAGDECIGLPGGGGFCARGGLADVGESCRELAGAERRCGPGLACRTGRCVRLCRGDFMGVAGSSGHCTSTSAECADDEVCEGPTENARWGWCVHRPPEYPSPEGGGCGVADECACPFRCVASLNGSPPFCARRDVSSCDACPAGRLCRSVVGEDRIACIEPGSLRPYDPCDDDAQCQPELRCDPGTGTCQP
ncbi:MAG: hypothetical protein AB8I08_20595 [Sandaracinaceae bacterium]